MFKKTKEEWCENLATITPVVNDGKSNIVHNDRMPLPAGRLFAGTLGSNYLPKAEEESLVFGLSRNVA